MSTVPFEAPLSDGPGGEHALIHTPGRGIERIELPPEKTHRRFQNVKQAIISQTAAGFTTFAAPASGLHYVKILGAVLVLDAAGSLAFYQGAGAGLANANTDVPMGGALPLAANSGFVLPVTDPADPWLFGDPAQSVSIYTVTGKAFGWIVWCESPYDQ